MSESSTFGCKYKNKMLLDVGGRELGGGKGGEKKKKGSSLGKIKNYNHLYSFKHQILNYIFSKHLLFWFDYMVG